MKTLIAFLLLATPFCAQSATVPKPPAQLCIDDNCVTAPLTQGKKWHPGMGIKTGSYRTLLPSELSAAATLPNFGFVDAIIGWGQIEPTIGHYDWSMIDTDLKSAKSIGRKMTLAITWKKFGSSNPTGVLPSDMIADAYGGGYVAVGTTGAVAKVWRPEVMDQYIAMLKAVADRYDGDPDLEMVLGGESTPSLIAPLPSDYSRSALAIQLKRLYIEGASTFQHTNYMAFINYLSGEITGLIEAAYKAGCGLADPDAIPGTPVYNLFRGVNATGEAPAIRDYRGLMPHYAIASQQTLGGRDDNGPPPNIIAWAKGYGVTHLSWVTYQPSPNSFSDIQSAILASPALLAACPYVGGCAQ